ncbi:polynucleotide adenylyltransferase PcnB [Desulfogranum marinum]|uniref:polynucleotide adenylyltransferase PcnB n=1 Tax=Desulfogranum marinum TaxID=453220 RepID=UPI0029C7330F|nr:polynucleotide adenylyltransferase PcnB [Desulfogranum marinum]
MDTDSSIAALGRGYQRCEPLIIPESEHPIRESQLDIEALKVLYRLRDAGFKGYLVGGGVRDLYLGENPKDFDISTDARPGQLRKLFRNSRTIGRRFRLVQVFFRGNKIIEVSTLRSQSEHDLNGPQQVLPHNNTFGTLEEDAFRRDLTINALFYEIETNTIIDYIGGVNDLNTGVVRMVGDPHRRFTRDPVRIMRAIRHAARKGFTIDSPTREAIGVHADKLLLCPASRVRDEILKDLQSGTSQKWAQLCIENNIWNILFPLYTNCFKSNERQNIIHELYSLLSVVDRLYGLRKQKRQVVIPEYMLFAALLLPWAIRRFNLLEVQLRGKGYHVLNRKIRADLDSYLGEQFNVKRMAKDALAILLVNLPTFHQLENGGKIPKWLKRKSYYRDCTRFYAIYRESLGKGEVEPHCFFQEQHQQEAVVMPPENGTRSKKPGRRGVNPAFSSKKQGVFGLRNRG